MEGMELGEDDTTVLAGLPTGEAIPGILGSVQLESGSPHKTRLFVNADSGNPESAVGISPEIWFPEILKSCRVCRLNTPMEPENWFSSRRKVSKCFIRLIVAGISPEKLLYDRSSRYRPNNEGSDGGNSPEIWL